MAAKLTDAERAAIVATLRECENVTETARRHGRGKATVSRIAKAEGIDATERSRTKRACEALVVDNAAKRALLIAGMYEDALRLHEQMFEPCVERKAMIVSDGEREGSHVEIVDVELPQPTFGDKRNIAVSMKVLADGARGLEAVDETGQDQSRSMLERLMAGLREAS